MPYRQPSFIPRCNNQIQDQVTLRYWVKACTAGVCSESSNTQDLYVGIEPRSVETVSETTYIHTDALRSPVAETDASGAVVKRMAYTPWGVPADGIYTQGPGYTGHVTDAATGLSYMQQRYYDPVGGRFVSPDPVRPDAANFNRYAYALNNPYRYIDPDGQFESSPWLLATVPGQASFDNAMTSVESGSYGHAAMYGAAMLGEQLLTVMTLGQGRAAGALNSAIVPSVKAASGTRAFIEDLAGSTSDFATRRGGNINYNMTGGKGAWDAARQRISEGLNITATAKDGNVIKGMTKDGATVEIRTFSSGMGKDFFTIKISETGSHIKHMFGWEKK